MSEEMAKYFSDIDRRLNDAYNEYIAAIRAGEPDDEIKRLKQAMIDAGDSGD